ncbi:MAG: hypothetical protein ACTSUE_13840, partial [Promethearchaeota archaeon]
MNLIQREEGVVVFFLIRIKMSLPDFVIIDSEVLPIPKVQDIMNDRWYELIVSPEYKITMQGIQNGERNKRGEQKLEVSQLFNGAVLTFAAMENIEKLMKKMDDEEERLQGKNRPWEEEKEMKDKSITTTRRILSKAFYLKMLNLFILEQSGINIKYLRAFKLRWSKSNIGYFGAFLNTLESFGKIGEAFANKRLESLRTMVPYAVQSYYRQEMLGLRNYLQDHDFTNVTNYLRGREPQRTIKGIIKGPISFAYESLKTALAMLYTPSSYTLTEQMKTIYNMLPIDKGQNSIIGRFITQLIQDAETYSWSIKTKDVKTKEIAQGLVPREFRDHVRNETLRLLQVLYNYQYRRESNVFTSIKKSGRGERNTKDVFSFVEDWQNDRQKVTAVYPEVFQLEGDHQIEFEETLMGKVKRKEDVGEKKKVILEGEAVEPLWYKMHAKGVGNEPFFPYALLQPGMIEQDKMFEHLHIGNGQGIWSDDPSTIMQRNSESARRSHTMLVRSIGATTPSSKLKKLLWISAGIAGTAGLAAGGVLAYKYWDIIQPFISDKFNKWIINYFKPALKSKVPGKKGARVVMKE